ncbi:MAG: FprA family A-type flavoprotein [Muribaculaceae bacterium]|nr:FprA family A-type flavoprotein [Muribaculaceae bacterium]
MNKNITPSIKYIGVDDTMLDLFESQYIIPNGISYNSYLILDKKVAIMDTVDRRMCDEWWTNLRNALNGRIPDYLVVHHMEPDHAGNIAMVLSIYPNLKIVATTKAIAMLPQFFENIDFNGRTIAVNEYEKLSLGSRSLQFFMAPMVHWPEVMITYDSTDKVMFTADAFGKFGALCYDEDWVSEARRYYFNICGKYGIPVQAFLKKISSLNIKHICPLHGPILSGNLEYYINFYDTWSKYEAESDGVFIAYASIHGGTKATALKIAEILKENGAKKIVITDLSRDDISKAVENAFYFSRMIVAASSYDGDVFPPMYDFLHHLKLKAYQRRRVGIIENGSWAPSAGRVMKEMLCKMKELNIINSIVTIRSTIKEGDYTALKALADAILK